MKKTFSTLLILTFAIAANAQWAIDSLNTARTSIPAAVLNSKIVFGSGSGNAWDVFDITGNQHTSGLFSFSRSEIKFTKNGNKAFFAGGATDLFNVFTASNRIDIYNKAALAIASVPGPAAQAINNGIIVTAFPNPAKDYIVISVKGLKEMQRVITVLSEAGKSVYQQTIDSNNQDIKISTAAFTPGIYFYKINSGTQVATGKFVKQ